MIRVTIPYHLRTLSRVEGDLSLDIDGPITLRSVLDAIELRYPMLCGTIRDHTTRRRRPFIRFFACRKDFSNADVDTPLPEEVARGSEPLHIVGAIAGG